MDQRADSAAIVAMQDVTEHGGIDSERIRVGRAAVLP